MTNANDQTDGGVGAAAIRRIRIHTILEGLTIEHVAQRTGVCRETVSRRLKSTDMRIDDYMILCHSVGMDPAANLDEAIVESQRAPSPDPMRMRSEGACHAGL
ncbi:helix-turn-helix domain-containing protein [Bifidobacterium breve]|uniref:helix-turn-helix domain-containing protein n=1 Tax=Bifidobacterium breve TaxID=1685 RepID=UPI0006A09F28|nr:helix-turn-helix domain-containing protein [Bifidobacterium breve]AUD86778.1 hypothetical protein NRBB57_0759 [Bifidobacterium breve]KND53285.1 hypothetical protein BBRI4_14c23 [Bifidobacterium breve]MBD3901792.1 helix-turn-helix transcriptional regulator [Bifidobacterium breve]